MRLTLSLRGYHGQFGPFPVRQRKHRWREGSEIVVPKDIRFNDPRLKTAVEQSGKPVDNPFWNPPWEKPESHPQWIPERDDPRFDEYLPQPPPQSHPLWKDQAAYVFDENTKLQCRMDQAKALTKTVVVDGLPVEVEELVGAFRLKNQDKIIRSFVLQAVAWDQTRDKLPMWFKPAEPNDPYKFVTREDQLRKWHAETPIGPPYQKQADNILADLIRICAISNHDHSEAREGAPTLTESLKNRHLLNDCDFQTVYSHSDGDLLHLSGKLSRVIYGDAPLPPPAGKQAVDETVGETIPTLWPMKPTLDLLPKHIYDDAAMLTFKKTPSLSRPLYPHTIGISWGLWWDKYGNTLDRDNEPEDCLTRAFMMTFGAAVAQARLMHGKDVQGELRSPVVLQSIATNGFNFNFITLQLNTLDLSSPDGVKNIAWIDAGPQNNIREDWRPTTQMGSRDSQKPYVLREFNPVVFEKVLAMYLNGGVRWPQ